MLYNICCILVKDVGKEAVAVDMPGQVIDATLRVIEEHGVKDVTVRRVADELGRSTTVVTHYFPTRADLLQASLAHSFDESRAAAQRVMREGPDPLWAFLDWSVSAQHRGVWLELVAAYAAGIDASVSTQVDEFLEWWDARLLELLEGRVVDGRSIRETCDVIGVVVEGVILCANRPVPSGLTPEDMLRMTITPLLAR